jgi:hypothetical protein
MKGREKVVTWGSIVAVCGVIGACAAGASTGTVVWRLTTAYHWFIYFAAALALTVFARACFDAGRNARPEESATDAMTGYFVVALLASAAFGFSRNW